MLNLDFNGVLLSIENILNGLKKRELLENKTNVIDENSTSEQYASAEAVYNCLQEIYNYIDLKFEELNNQNNS